ncbi:hypothetical protein [Burkholderia cenocepacia]|uniref:hypothetical protein n=1 Tax=Burkholderia cenocepacia TaxID=95486 RepID=UPI000F59537B|nr:hypothetical protein [Burkholderia cenocepacia]
MLTFFEAVAAALLLGTKLGEGEAANSTGRRADIRPGIFYLDIIEIMSNLFIRLIEYLTVYVILLTKFPKRPPCPISPPTNPA